MCRQTFRNEVPRARTLALSCGHSKVGRTCAYPCLSAVPFRAWLDKNRAPRMKNCADHVTRKGRTAAQERRDSCSSNTHQATSQARRLAIWTERAAAFPMQIPTPNCYRRFARALSSRRRFFSVEPLLNGENRRGFQHQLSASTAAALKESRKAAIWYDKDSLVRILRCSLQE